MGAINRGHVAIASELINAGARINLLVPSLPALPHHVRSQLFQCVSSSIAEEQHNDYFAWRVLWRRRLLANHTVKLLLRSMLRRPPEIRQRLRELDRLRI